MAAQADTAEKRAKLEQAEQVRQNKGNAQAIPDVLRSGVIGGLRSSFTEVSRKEADLTARYGAQHPLVVNVRAERRDLEGAMSAEIGRILQVLKNDYDVALARQRALEKSLAEVTGQTTRQQPDVGASCANSSARPRPTRRSTRTSSRAPRCSRSRPASGRPRPGC